MGTNTMVSGSMIAAAAVSLMACFQEMSAQTFGFRTCTELVHPIYGVSRSGNFAIDYQIGFQRFTCTIEGAPEFDTVYTRESPVPYDICFGGSFFQISNDGNDDMSFCSIIFDGEEIELGRQQIGNGKKPHVRETFKRRYELDADANIIAQPRPVGDKNSERSLPLCCQFIDCYEPAW